MLIIKHIQYIKMSAEKNLRSIFTLVYVKQNLLQNYPTLINIRLRILSMTLNKRLKLSFKKLGVTNPEKILPKHKYNLTYWWKAIIGLFERKFYLIFTDEFWANRDTINSYGWELSNRHGGLVKRPTNFKMSFEVAHSQDKIEGIIKTKTTFDQNKYLKFLKSLCRKLETCKIFLIVN